MVKEMKQTEIGLIPEDWEVKVIGDITEKLVGGGTPSRSVKEYWNGNIPWMTVKDFASFNGHSTQEYITELGLKSSATRIVKASNLIIATRIALGKIVKYKVDVTINQDLKTITLSSEVNKDYFSYFYQSIENKIIEKGSGSTVLGLSIQDLYSFQIPLPPLPEQEAIAEALSDADAWIESLEQLIAKKRLIKQGAMQELLTPKEGWEVKKFEQVFLKVPSKKYQINSNEYFQVGRYPIVDQGQQKIVGYSDREDKVFFPGNIIVFGDHTRIIKYVNYPFIVGADGVQLLSSLNENIQFLYYLLSDYEIPNTGYNRHFKYLKDFDYHIPSLTEQTRIANILSDMDAELEALEAQLAKARQIKQGMMQELLTGRIRLEL